MNFTCTTHEWTAPDGGRFPYSQWQPDPAVPVRAILVAVHGLSGAALDFEPLAAHLLTHGVATLALELRGQGNDPLVSRRGDLTKLAEWYADLHAFLALARSKFAGASLYLYGESMGGALLTCFLAQAAAIDQPGGLILASPVVALPRAPTKLQAALFRFFYWLRPTFRIDVRKFAKIKKGEPPPYVTRDEAHRKWFETAPHRLDRYTIRFFRCLHDLVAGCFAAAPHVRAPVLVIYAAHDIFIQPQRVEEFFALIGSVDKECCLFPESYHLLLHDHDRALALRRIEQWLLAHLPVRRVT